MVFKIENRVVPSVSALRKKLGAVAWRRNMLSAGVVMALTAAGTVLPGMLLAPGLEGYVSETTVRLDNPQQATVGTEKITAQLRENLFSPMTLGLMVSELGLQSGDLVEAQHQGHLGVLMDILTGGENGGVVVGATEDALKKAVWIAAAPSSNEIDVNVTAATSEAAQRIASYIAGRIVKEIGTAQQNPALAALEQARIALDSAEASLTGFQMRNGNDAVSHIQGLQQRIREDDASTSALNARKTELSDAIAAASAMKADDVLNRALPAIDEFSPLETIRQNYAAAKLALAEVGVDHGPKHPRMIAAQATVDSERATVMPALRRVLETLKREHAAITADLDARAGTRAGLDKKLQAMGTMPAELEKLEAALEKARRDYIRSSDAIGTLSNAPRLTAALEKEAQPGVANYDSFTANAMALAGGAAGLLTALFALSFRHRRNEQDDIEAVEEPSFEMTDDNSSVAELEAAPSIEIEPAIFDDIFPPEIVSAPAETQDVQELDQPQAIQQSEPNIEADELEAANDAPLDERIKQVLMRNKVRVEPQEKEAPVFKLPPLLAAALAGKADHPQAETEELQALRRELAQLKTRVSAASRDVSRRNHG